MEKAKKVTCPLNCDELWAKYPSIDAYEYQDRWNEFEDLANATKARIADLKSKSKGYTERDEKVIIETELLHEFQESQSCLEKRVRRCPEPPEHKKDELPDWLKDWPEGYDPRTGKVTKRWRNSGTEPATERFRIQKDGRWYPKKE